MVKEKCIPSLLGWGEGDAWTFGDLGVGELLIDENMGPSSGDLRQGKPGAWGGHQGSSPSLGPRCRWRMYDYGLPRR